MSKKPAAAPEKKKPAAKVEPKAAPAPEKKKAAAKAEPAKAPAAAAEPAPAEKKHSAKPGTNPFLQQHPSRAGRVGPGSKGSYRGGR